MCFSLISYHYKTNLVQINSIPPPFVPPAVDSYGPAARTNADVIRNLRLSYTDRKDVYIVFRLSLASVGECESTYKQLLELVFNCSESFYNA